LLPGWQLFLGTNAVKYVGYDSPLEPGYATLITPKAPGIVPIEGNYALVFYPPWGEPFHLSQRGEIPAEARVLRYLSLGDVRPTFNGLELKLDGVDGSRNLWYWDVRQFAGQEVELGFTFTQQMLSGGSLDSIAFAVPEPSPLLFLGLSGSLFALLLAQRSRHRQSWRRSLL
jgi:hypothetical protein